MKKSILILLIFLSIGAKSQDTAYSLRGNQLYMTVRTTTPVTDNSSWSQYQVRKERNRKRSRRQNIIAFGAFAIAIIAFIVKAPR